MKKALIIPLILITLLGCSKSPNSAETSKSAKQSGSQSADSFIPTDPSEITLIETAEKKEKLSIEAQSSAFFAAKDFGKLEDLANNYRLSKESSVSGSWKLEYVYAGIVPDVEDSNDVWDERIATLHEWIQAKPDSITARVALANVLVTFGWKARGTDFANSVTDSGWKLLGERLTAAVQVLKDAQILHEKCPFAWKVMMDAALGLGVDKAQYDNLFQKAVASEPDFSVYYVEKAYYLTPRWYGGKGEMAAFLKEVADQVGGEDGDLLYARVAWRVQHLTGDIFEDPTLSWPRVDKGFEIMEEQFPDSLYVQNGRAYMAVMGSDKMNAPRRLVGALRGQIDLGEWTSKEKFLLWTKQFVSN
jgi:Domain of unknown function (DUF4034)